ncbi:hypothetical protein Tdes44962_MAKER01759 [Teratosphaeria destructans]|uniref:SprT-like domain-containing protein n=1 Tax=Teratosphaeria destructans TaxID=418781 RepID=A0A9W7SXA6_9PEZI|nr:hypothetical protein Tdes44962_MAKER01759 [Teratosphaeria destructans]
MAHIHALETVQRAIESFDKPVALWDRSQQAALANLQARASTFKIRLGQGDHSMLQEIVRLFGDIFFLESMRNLAAVESSPRLYGNLGNTISSSQVLQNGTSAHVRIQIANDVEGPMSSGENVMGTILHECVHAFISLTACMGLCSAACERQAQDELGTKSRHGSAWQILAEATERVANDTIPGFCVKLGRTAEIETHILREGLVLPREVMAKCFPGKKLKLEDWGASGLGLRLMRDENHGFAKGPPLGSKGTIPCSRGLICDPPS